MSNNAHNSTPTEQGQTMATSIMETPAPIESQMSSPSTRQDKKQAQNKSGHPRDDLAAAAIFFAVGLYLSYFTTDAHIPAFQGLFQTIAYIFYGIGFLGGMFGMSKLSNNEFFSSFGIGAILGVAAYGIHALADHFTNILAVSIILRLVMIPFLAFAAYGIVQGITYLLMREEMDASQPKEKMKPEQFAGLTIALLSVVTALIQALPSILPTIKQLFHLP